MRFIALVALMFSISAHAFTVKKCVDGTRSFKIIEDTVGRLTGEFQDFTGAPKSYGRCQRVPRTQNYKCFKGDYIALYIAGRQPQVQFELKGDFYPDSGYLFSLYCDQK